MLSGSRHAFNDWFAAATTALRSGQVQPGMHRLERAVRQPFRSSAIFMTHASVAAHVVHPPRGAALTEDALQQCLGLVFLEKSQKLLLEFSPDFYII